MQTACFLIIKVEGCIFSSCLWFDCDHCTLLKISQHQTFMNPA